MPRPFLAATALLAACALNNQASDGGPGTIDVTIGVIPFRVTSGAARIVGSVLGLYLTDQPDACLAITNIPVGKYTIFSLRVAPQLDGTPAASVVTNEVTPGPGHAVGGISAQTTGVETAGYVVANGSVAWAANTDGTYTIISLDVGFEGATEWLHARGLTFPLCP